MILNFKRLFVKNYVLPHYGIIFSHSVQTDNFMNLIKLETNNILVSKLFSMNTIFSHVFDIYLFFYSIKYFESYFNTKNNKKLINIEKSFVFMLVCFISNILFKGLGIDIFLLFLMYHIPNNHKRYVDNLGNKRDLTLDLFFNVFFMSLANGVYQEYPNILSNNIFIVIAKGLFLTYMMYNKKYIEKEKYLF